MADLYVGSRRVKSNHAAIAASLALLAGMILSSSVPVDAAPAQPGIHPVAQPTATPCITVCAGGINHR